MRAVRASSWILVGLLATACSARANTSVPACIATAAAANSGALRFPIQRAGACLVDAAGAPVWLTGEAAWSLIVRLDDAGLDRYLADRRARGINALVVNLVEHKYADHPPANLAGDAPFTTPGDFSTPSEPYFAHADRVLARAAAAGIVVLLAPAYLGFKGEDEGWYVEVRRSGPDKMRAYGRFLGKRYRNQPNLIWLEGGDTPPMSARKEVDALVAGIREADTTHLHAAHSTRYHSALDDYDRPWLDLNTTYSDCEGHGRALQRDATRRRTIPTLFIEGTYEGENASPACILSQAYRTLLSGAAGHMFGNRPLWLFDPGWPAALDSPGSRAMQHLAKLVADRNLRPLTPDFTGTLVSGDNLSVARTPSGTLLAFVDAGPRTLTVAPSFTTTATATATAPAAPPASPPRAAAPGAASPATAAGTASPTAPSRRTARWFDPAEGTFRDAGTHDAIRPLKVTSPAGGPWLLIVEPAP